KGKEVAANNCSACHQLEKTDAPNLMGPSLTNIGGYASVDYLRESIVNPSAVVVPGYNRNAHSAYEWYTLDNGKRTSTMPEFSWLEQADMENLIAYLKTLKAEVK
ncbi:MAG: cytochrome c, partial [Thiovulaceae bacterium]|nr:cytochrome c [Sulfurimonadaceae bacterium]